MSQQFFLPYFFNHCTNFYHFFMGQLITFGTITKRASPAKIFYVIVFVIIIFMIWFQPLSARSVKCTPYSGKIFFIYTAIFTGFWSSLFF